jgi:hypothetical protein
MTFGIHPCRGNFRSRCMAEGGYEPIAEKLFNAPKIDAFFLEYDSERAGDFRSLRFATSGRSGRGHRFQTIMPQRSAKIAAAALFGSRVTPTRMMRDPGSRP